MKRLIIACIWLRLLMAAIDTWLWIAGDSHAWDRIGDNLLWAAVLCLFLKDTDQRTVR